MPSTSEEAILARHEIAEDINYLLLSCQTRGGVSVDFVAGLETARDIALGRVAVSDGVSDDSNQPKLFDLDENL